MKTLKLILIFLLLISMQGETMAYPYDGYFMTGIRRLLRLQLVMAGVIQDKKPVPGAQKTLSEIKLNLMNTKGDSLSVFPKADPALQKTINSLFPNMDESYSVCLLDITPGKPTRYAYRQDKRGFMPGSVAKLAVIAGLFNQLAIL